MAAPAVIPPSCCALSERAFQQQVIDLSSAFGWAHFHNLHSRGSDPGWPDLVLCRPPEMIVVELKAERGRLSEHQREWLRALGLCGVEVCVWRPSDWLAIAERLGRR